EVVAMDVLAPGIGEIIGGSQREERLEVMDRSMAERGIDGEQSQRRRVWSNAYRTAIFREVGARMGELNAARNYMAAHNIRARNRVGAGNRGGRNSRNSRGGPRRHA